MNTTVELQENKTTVILSHPLDLYESGKTYVLKVTSNVKAEDGKTLLKPVIMEFTVE